MSGSLKNGSLATHRKFLRKAGCNNIRTSGGHEIWSRKDLLRPIVVQTHVDPVPEFLTKNAIKVLGIDRNRFLKIIGDL
jgi:hypothetical protein